MIRLACKQYFIHKSIVQGAYMIKLTKKDYIKMFNILEEYQKDTVQGVDFTILEAVEQRKDGKSFSFKEHLRGFIYAQLSALVSWKKIKENQPILDKIFCNFDRLQLKEKSAEDLINEITAIKCHNPYTTKNQMRSLKANIETFEKIEQSFGSLDNFITHNTPSTVIKLLADSNSTYKLKYAGIALVCEYLRNVGVDIVKPDVHIKRIASAERLNLITSKDDYKILDEFKKLAQEIEISQVKMDFLLWNYCSKGYGGICTATPKCDKCVIKNYCNIKKKNKFNKNLDLKSTDNIVDEFFNETSKISLLKQEFKNYLIQKYPNVSQITIDTYISDGFYMYRHNHEFSIDFFDLFKDKQNIENFSNKIISQQTNIKRIKKPKASAKAYINGLNRLYDFFNEKYNGVENFINS